MKTEFNEITDSKRLCRVCMVPGEDHFTSLYEKFPSDQPSLHEMLQAICAPVFANTSDDAPEMPDKVCHVCHDAIVAAFNLHQQCIETDRRLGEVLTFEKKFDYPEENGIAGEPADYLNENVDTLTMAAANNDAISTNSSKTCTKCGRVFARYFTLNRHMKNGSCPGKKISTDPLFETITTSPKVCPKCGKEFLRQLTLDKHILAGACSKKRNESVVMNETSSIERATSVEKESITCAQCNRTFSRISSLHRHKKASSCAENCRNSKKRKYSEANPVPKIENSGDVMINSPSTSSENVVMIKVEPLELTHETAYLDSNLPENVPIKTENAVAAQETIEERKTCQLCSETAENLSKLKVHIRTSHRMYLCVICEAIFPTRHVLWYHTLKHREPDVACNVCGKKMSSKYNLELHMMRHTGKKMFRCELCSVRFTTLGEKEKHKQIHKKEQPFVCHICGRKVGSRHALSKHIREVHDKLMRFSCTICNRKFSNRSRLNCHMLTHTKEKPFKCQLCPQAYAQSNDLVKHVTRTHWAGKPYPCDRCDESFRLVEELREHYCVHVQSGDCQTETEDVRFTIMALMNKLFARIKQQQVGENSGTCSSG